MQQSDIFGHKKNIDALINSVQCDRVGHAYLFTGPAGVGKRTVAQFFSALLLCENPVGGEACNSCMPCRLSESGANPDFSILDPDGNTISIDEIRKIQEDLVLKPLYSKKKVYIVADAHRMTMQAQNCLLKTLEEPPSYASLILTTAMPDALVDTLRSRVLKLSFQKNSADEVKRYLIERFGENISGMAFITAYSDGIIGQAVKLADSEEFMLLRDEAINLANRLLKNNLLEVFESYSFFEKHKADIEIVLDILQLYFRDLLVVQKVGEQNRLINSDKKDMILGYAGCVSPHRLAGIIHVMEQTRRKIKQNANYQLSIEVMLMKLQEEI